MQLFTRRDIEKSFTSTILARGAHYAKAGYVLDAWTDQDETINGKVKGSDFEPYEVQIEAAPGRGFIRLRSDCTCPYGDQCKHGAAVALYALDRELRVIESEEDEDSEPEQERDFAFPETPPVSLEIPMADDVKDWLSRLEKTIVTEDGSDLPAKQRLFYRLQKTRTRFGAEIPTVTPINRNLLKSGEFGAASEIKSGSITSPTKPKHWTARDLSLIADLEANAPRVEWSRPEYRLDGKHGSRLLRDLLDSKRCVWTDLRGLTFGEPREGVFQWETSQNKGLLSPQIKLPGNGIVLAAFQPWYVDLGRQECGIVECGLSPEFAGALIRSAPIEPENVFAVRVQLEKLGLPVEMLPELPLKVVVSAPKVVPCLSVDFELCASRPYSWNEASVTVPLAFGMLTFEYDGITAPSDGKDVRVVEGGELRILKRNRHAETYARDFLLKEGWSDPTYCRYDIPKGRGKSLCFAPLNPNKLLEPVERVSKFSEIMVPKLRAAGWKVEIEDNFRYVPESEVEWDISLESGSGVDWFEFQLGIRVEGEPLDLKAVLAQLFKEQGSDRLLSSGARESRGDDFFVFGPGGRAIKLSRNRLSAILQPLLELFGGVGEWPEELRLSKAMLPEVSKFEKSVEAAAVPWKSSEELVRLNQKFAAFDHLEPAQEPEGFTGQLREYQREGLAWLQFLREYGFGGVLADDMGLGKTVQVLAHIQMEKISGRMDRPCLIVAPTSTMPNWRRECERFTPGLKVLTLQGSGRASRFAELKDVDIALTTYPLLARDKDLLSKVNYHLLVLDEAQNVKNPITAAAKAARGLGARHRICLSGTPVENHLGELWSLFQFLMPSFLGTDADFKKKFRGPIEKLGDGEARQRLARRIRPFMLRRTKGQVVLELPAKTEIVETIEFDDPQRDLYESIRSAMDEQVRSLLASQGFEKSRIQILDALLKLRQVCCDPRLVKLPSAKDVKASAKLERLMEMLTVLLEDGRRILLFSQFTSMLDLIEERLRTAEIPWVRISGDTVDRETPVQEFQAEKVALFLISLKAGGTGLNLTAADTVILYDPWWNPAVENQAIDRAHRIGQKKAVIVYKLVAARTIEEKMLEMQVRKGDIAKSILTDDADGIRTLTADDLKWVFSVE